MAVETGKTTREEFFSRLAHALKGPLQSSLGFAELLGMGRYGELNEQQTEIVFRIGDRSEELAGLIDGVMELISLEVGGRDEGSRSVRSEVLLENALGRQRSELEGRGVFLEREERGTEAGLRSISGDAGLLEGLLQLVVRHVADGMEQGTVTVRTETEAREDGRLRVLFTITGSPSSEAADAGEPPPGDGENADREPPILVVARFIAESHGGELQRLGARGRDGVSVALPATEG